MFYRKVTLLWNGVHHAWLLYASVLVWEYLPTYFRSEASSAVTMGDCVHCGFRCLVWLATGPDVLTLPHAPTATERASSCAFLADLCKAQVRVDVAVVGMTYGAAWAAQQLVDLGIARVALHVQADATLVGQHVLFNACVGITQQLFRMAIFQTVPQDVEKSLTAIWDTEYRRILSESECKFGVVDSRNDASPLLGGLHPGEHQAFTPQVPVACIVVCRGARANAVMYHMGEGPCVRCT